MVKSISIRIFRTTPRNFTFWYPSSLSRGGLNVFSRRNFRHIQVYQCQISVFDSTENQYRGIHIHYLETAQRSVFEIFENLKINLHRKYEKLPNPATFLVNAKLPYSLEERLLSIAKRALVGHICHNVA